MSTKKVYLTNQVVSKYFLIQTQINLKYAANVMVLFEHTTINPINFEKI